MRSVLDAIRNQTHKCIRLQEIASSEDNHLSFEEAQKLREIQDKEYKKLQWMKQISKAMDEQKRKDGDKDGRKTNEIGRIS